MDRVPTSDPVSRTSTPYLQNSHSDSRPLLRHTTIPSPAPRWLIRRRPLSAPHGLALPGLAPACRSAPGVLSRFVFLTLVFVIIHASHQGNRAAIPCFPSTPTQLFFSTAMVRCNTRLYSMGKQQPRQSEGWRPRTWHGSFTYSSFDTVPAAVQALHLLQV